jgi:isoleucyl-tRNA synthetase
LDLWRERKTFRRSVEERPEDRTFVFYEGPPTANGRPGFHHALARSFKDLIPRYKTMQGYRVERKGGWDTHGLPVEIGVEKELGLQGKDDIERYGVEDFNRLCRESVFRHVDDWKAMSERLGFWVDMDDPYKTLDGPYIESVWWALKTLHEKDLLYEGYKVSAHCPRDQTSLSAAEVALGYQQYPEDVVDPSVYVRLPLEGDENTSLLIWTTTPWTLVSNAAVAANPKVDYATVEKDGESLIVASDLLEKVFGEDGYRVVETRKGSELEGLKYRRPLDYVDVESSENLWTVVLGEYVTTTEGTGLVHTAPAYGEDDARVGRRYGLPTIHPVKPDGTFDGRVGPFAGQFVKKADPGLVEALRERGVLFRAEEYAHAYPHCWRCGTPLLYYAKKAWYARTTAVLDDLLSENEGINWVPEHVKWGRFGDWLRNNIDWALSRERYWGTPLPIWRTESGDTVVVGSVEELKELALDPVPEDLHRPYIDNVRVRHPETGEEARRVPEVLDVWFDSGSMPFAQYAYPHSGAEGSRALRAPVPSGLYLRGRGPDAGLVLLAAGRLDDALRQVLVQDVPGARAHPGLEGQEDEQVLGQRHRPVGGLRQAGGGRPAVGALHRDEPGQHAALQRGSGRRGRPQVPAHALEHLLLLRHLRPHRRLRPEAGLRRARGQDPHGPLGPLRAAAHGKDRHRAPRRLRRDGGGQGHRGVRGRALELVRQAQPAAVLEGRGRPGQEGRPLDPLRVPDDGHEAHGPLHPVRRRGALPEPGPERRPRGPRQRPPGGLAPPQEQLVDEGLSRRMAAARRVVGLGRAARNAAAVKNRQPLREVVVVDESSEGGDLAEGVEVLKDIVLDELNVKALRFGAAEDVTHYDLKPNLGVVGPKYGRRVPGIRRALAEAPPSVGARAAAGEAVTVEVEGEEVTLSPEELLVEPTRGRASPWRARAGSRSPSTCGSTGSSRTRGSCGSSSTRSRT